MTQFLNFLLFSLSLIYSFCSCLSVFFYLKKKKIDVFLSPEGGFGPTIFKSIVLKCYYAKKNRDDYILIFGFNPRRHNRLVKDIFGIHFTWLALSSKYIPFGKISDKNKYFIFRFLKFILINFSNVKNVYDFNNYFCDKWKILSFPQEEQNKYGNYRKFHKFIYENEKFINFNLEFLENYKNKIKFDKSKKKVGIFFRSKGSKSKNNLSSYLRDSNILENYKSTIEESIKKNWQVFISGDLDEFPEWLNQYGDMIVHRKKFKLTKDEFNLFVGLSVDCFITTGSGPVAWKLINPNKPHLVLDAYPLAFGWYKSTVAYKFLFNDKKTSFLNIFQDNKLIINPPTSCRMSSQQELHSIVMEFLSDFEYGKISGYSPEELNLPADSLLASGYAKVSKTWCKLQKELIKNY
jgi:hypothetical protein